MFRVYQCEINDARYHEVNAKGWEGVDWGKAYMDVTMGTLKNQSADDIVVAAAVKGLYTHTKTVDLENKEKVFEILNIGADFEPYEYEEKVTSYKMSKSMSVGDVLITPDHKGYYCDGFGFKELTEYAVFTLECWTTTQVKVA